MAKEDAEMRSQMAGETDISPCVLEAIAALCHSIAFLTARRFSFFFAAAIWTSHTCDWALTSGFYDVEFSNNLVNILVSNAEMRRDFF